jgi:hypothetical protein
MLRCSLNCGHNVTRVNFYVTITFIYQGFGYVLAYSILYICASIMYYSVTKRIAKSVLAYIILIIAFRSRLRTGLAETC